MYQQRLKTLIYRLINNPDYQAKITNGSPYPCMTDLLTQTSIIERMHKDLVLHWDLPESRFFRNLAENDKYLLYQLFVYRVFLKYRENQGILLEIFWDKTYEKICNFRETNISQDLTDLNVLFDIE